MTPSIHVHVATSIIAPNDNSGNPRQGYLVRKVVVGQTYGEGSITFIDAGYEGEQALRDRFPDAIITCCVWVTVAEWRTRVLDASRMGGEAA
jgi:hypothetical protein